MLEATAAAAYLERQRKRLQARVLGDKADQVEQDTVEWIHDDVAIAPTDIPLLVDKDRVACETVLHTETGRDLPTLIDSGAQVSALIDKEELKLWMPGADYVELHGSTHEVHGFGPLKVDKRRIIIMLIKCYAAGPTVRLPALVADLKGFNVVMFIGLPGLRHMRAKLDWSDPSKMVLDMGRGGCTHTITVVAGKEQLTVKPTAVQLLPQPARKLGPPPGHTTEGFDNTETLGSYAVGAAALYDFLPTAELDISDPHETSELTAIVTRMVAAIRDVETASDACHPYEQLVLANTVDFRLRGVGAAAAWSDRQQGERRVGEMTMEAKIQATRVDLTSPTVHPTLEQCRKKCDHIPDRNEREHYAQALFKYSKRFYCSGALPAMRGYEFDIELDEGAKGFMHKPIPQTREKLELLHAQLDEWILARHMRLMTARERSKCYRASKLFWKTERGKLRPCVDYSTLNQECSLVAYPMPDMDAIRRDLAGLDVYIGLDVRAAFNQVMLSTRAGLAMAVIIPGRNRGDPPVIFVPERMGFGHLSSPAFFSGIVGDLLTGISHDAQRCRSYLDDITGGAKGGYAEGFALFEDIMQRTAASGMLFAFDKLQFLVPELRVLGLNVSVSGVEPDPTRCEELINWPEPRTTKEVQGYIGLYNWLARNMPQSTTAALRELQGSCKRKFEWSDKLRDASPP